MVTRINKFKLLLEDKEKNVLDIDYRLHDTVLARKWFTKLKHLRNIPVDPIESCTEDVSNLHEIYTQFCKFAEIDCLPISTIVNQKECNLLHKVFEENHERLSRRKNNKILYKFHHAIHSSEKKKHHATKTKIDIGWGIKEGPLTEVMQCQPFYEEKLQKNNLYLPWSELGKTPYIYWINNEPTEQKRFNMLCKPHITFRAKFFIALHDIEGMTFPNQFNQYFNQFKQQWLKHYGIDDWTERDEWSAPLLAHTDSTIDLHEMVFQKIIL